MFIVTLRCGTGDHTNNTEHRSMLALSTYTPWLSNQAVYSMRTHTS